MQERSRWLTLAMVIFSALALLAFAACGGGDDDDDSGGDNTATATRDGGDDGGDATDAPNDGGDNSDDPFADLADLSDNLEGATGKVAYTQTDTDADGNVTSSTFTIYSKPPNSRWDSGDPDDPSATTILISTADTTYSCTVADETCVSFPGGGGGSAGLFGGLFSAQVITSYVSIFEAAGVDVNHSDENIAGDDATCFSWDEDVSNDISKGKMCFNDAGQLVLLESEEADGSKTSMRATEYSEDVSDDVFEPPYDVTELQ
ncbi:MAG: hypothetical protein AAB092_03200 [Chloroflexota bacterium]